jgi:hypothetical protein
MRDSIEGAATMQSEGELEDGEDVAEGEAEGRETQQNRFGGNSVGVALPGKEVHTAHTLGDYKYGADSYWGAEPYKSTCSPSNPLCYSTVQTFLPNIQRCREPVQAAYFSYPQSAHCPGPAGRGQAQPAFGSTPFIIVKMTRTRNDEMPWLYGRLAAALQTRMTRVQWRPAGWKGARRSVAGASLSNPIL